VDIVVDWLQVTTCQGWIWEGWEGGRGIVFEGLKHLPSNVQANNSKLLDLSCCTGASGFMYMYGK